MVSFTLRWLAGWVSRQFTEDGRDYFEKYLGPSQTMKVIKRILGDEPKKAILEFMMRYMMSTQKKKAMTEHRTPDYRQSLSEVNAQ